MTDTDAVQRVQALRKRMEGVRTQRSRAEATIEQASSNLTAILQEHGVSSVEELEAKAQEAAAEAETMLRAAEAALPA